MHFFGTNVLLGLALVAVHADASFFSECGFNGTHKEPNYRPHSALLKDPPRYPREALRRGTEGFVLVEFTVTEEGSVADATVIESALSAHSDGMREDFERAALGSVNQYRFVPATKAGHPISTVGVRDRVKWFMTPHDPMSFRSDNVRLKIADWQMRSEFEKAIRYLNRRFARSRNDVDRAGYLYLRAQTEDKMGLIDQAIQSVRQSQTLYEPIRGDLAARKLRYLAGGLLGSLYAEKELWTQSLVERKHALAALLSSQAPRSASLVYNAYADLGIAAIQTKDWCTAHISLSKAIQLSKQYGRTPRELWLQAYQIAWDEWSKIDEDAETVNTETKPLRRIRPLFYLTPQALAESQILIDENMLDEAIDVLNNALEIREKIYDGGFDGPSYRSHDLAQIHDRLGRAAAIKGDDLQAIEHFHVVVAQDENIPEALESVALYSLAELYRRSGRFERALGVIERGRGIDYDGSLPTPSRDSWTGDWSALKERVLNQGGKALLN